MADFDVSSTGSGGGTMTGQTFGISQPAYSDPSSAWMQSLQNQANALNAGQGGGNFGGGRSSSGGGPTQDPLGDIYKSGTNGFIPSLDFYLQNNQQGINAAHWNAAFGTLNGLLGQNPATIGGTAGLGPHITQGGVWNPQQVDQQVNQARASNDASAATQEKQQASSAAGRGFATNSPLVQALQGQTAAANIGTNASTEAGIRSNAAQMNAQQMLNTQTEAQNQFAAQQANQVAREKPYFDRQNALIAALASMS